VTTAAASDPFESTANAARYVPRSACERVLEAAEVALARGAGPVAITGPAGLGKSMLLSVLAERVAGRHHVVRLPYPALSAAELCRWVLEALGEPADAGGDDPAGALLDRAFRASAAGREILLLLDDVSSLPPRTARDLATLVSVSGGAIRAVLAAVDDARLGAALAALGAEAREVRFDEPMNADETAAYVRARIAPAGARGNRFDADTLARLYGATGGVPRRVHELGSAIWRSPDDADLPALVEGWVRGDEGREAEPAIVAIETDEPGEPVERIEPGEPAEDEPGEAERAAAGQLEAPPPPDAPRDGPRRAGGRWVALLALALLVVTLPYALSQVERWLEAGLPEPPAAEGARLDAPPADAATRFEEGEPATEPDAETGLEPEAETSLEPDAETSLDLDVETGLDLPRSAPESLGGGPGRETDELALATAGPTTGTGEPTRATGDAPTAAAEPASAPAPPERRRPRGIAVSVEASPPAVIHVDGGRVGTTPLPPLDLSPGLHVFRAEFASGRAVVRAVEISAQNRRVFFEPSPEAAPAVPPGDDLRVGPGLTAP